MGITAPGWAVLPLLCCPPYQGHPFYILFPIDLYKTLISVVPEHLPVVH